MNRDKEKQVKDTMPTNKNEAFFALEILASYKANALIVLKNEHLIVLKHIHFAFLYLVMYLLFLVLPLALFKDNLLANYPTLILYYVLYMLFIWNVSRTSQCMEINEQSQEIVIKNCDWFGKVVHRKKTIPFHAIKEFEAVFQSGKFGSGGKNLIYLNNQDGKKMVLLEIKSGGAGLQNGKMMAHALMILCNKPI